MSRRFRREEVDDRKSPSIDDPMKEGWRETPIGKSFKTRRSVRQEILLRWKEDWENAKLLPMGEEEDLPRQKKKRERCCATLSSDVGQRRETVLPPSEIARQNGMGKEVLEVDAKGHEFLGIDMDWGIHNRRPAPPVKGALGVDAPPHVRRVRRHFQVTIFEKKSPHRRTALKRRQRRNPLEIASRFLRQNDRKTSVALRSVYRSKVSLKKARMETNERHSGNHRCEMTEEDLEIAA